MNTRPASPWISLALLSAVGCGGAQEDIATTDEALHGTSAVDTTFPAVGRLNTPAGFCTATLIAPDVAMSAAHCFADLANGCMSPATARARTTFVLDASGDGRNTVTYTVDDIAFAPGVESPAASSCPAGSLYSCAAYHFHDKAHDLVLLHLVPPQNAPRAVPTVMPVLTSIVDDRPALFGVHISLDRPRGLFSGAANVTAPRPYAVGYGNADTTTLQRRSGRVDFDDPRPVHWHRGCAQEFSCASANPVQSGCSFVRRDGLTQTYSSRDGSYFSTDVVRAARTSSNSASPNFDGVIPGPGDSGGPLAVEVVSPAWPQLAVGVLSVSDQTAGGTTVRAGYLGPIEYAPTFTPENGRFIEATRLYWSMRFARRSLGWHPTFEPLGGTILSAPAAVASGERHVEVYARGGDDRLWFDTLHRDTTYWTGISDGAVSSGAGVSSWGLGRVDIVARGADGDVLHLWSPAPDDTRGPESLGGRVLAGTTPASAGQDALLMVTVTGTDQRVYTKRYEAPNGWIPSVTGWDLLDETQVQGSPAMVSWARGCADVFVRLSDNSLGHKWIRADGRGWLPRGQYERLGGALGSDPVAVSWAPGRIDLFYRPVGDPTAIAQWTMRDSVWSQPVTLPLRGGRSGEALGAASFAPGRIDLFARGTHDELLHTWFPNE